MSTTQEVTTSVAAPVRPELVIGLVAAVGTDHDQLTSILQDILRDFGYTSDVVRLASLLAAFPRYKNLARAPVDEYIRQHQAAGDDFRRITEQKNALAVLGLAAIQELRTQKNPEKGRIAASHAYIIRSLKTPEEVRTLRDIYGNAFILIGSSAPYHNRRKYLAGRIAGSRHNFQLDPYLADAEDIIQKDQQEVGNKFGQNLKNAFHLADIFLDASDGKRLRDSVKRGLELVFGNTFHTPTRDEYGMFHAMAAALRSAELGRQVGAAIATSSGDIVAVGTNEVPKAGGGLYWAGDDPDHREFLSGYDSSDLHKRGVLEDLLERLNKDGWLAGSKAGTDISQLAESALDPKANPNLSGAQVTDLIEFGRAVHGEMAAITDAARRGVSISGATLFVTTFPCHLCARLIVAAGIRQVVYIEPYTKSRAVQLYPDSIAVEDGDRSDAQVRFEPFVGVAPRKYTELFTMLDRKDRLGKVIEFDPPTAVPRLYGSPRAYLANENVSFAELANIIKSKQEFNEEYRYARS